MTALLKALAWLLTALQLLFLNVAYGPWGPAAEPALPSAPGNDITGDTTLSPSVLYAAEVLNVAQGYYNSADRCKYTVENAGALLTHELSSRTCKRATLRAPGGGVYLEDTMDVFYTAKGSTWYAANSAQKGRVNAIRLGLYYLEAHVRDLNFPLLSGGAFWADKVYHVYGDRLYQELKLYASSATTDLTGFGLEVKIPEIRVAAVDVTEGYAAFDIKDVGVVGFIIPFDGSTGTVNVERKGGNYVFTQTANYTPGTGINKNDESGGYALNCVRFGNRIYTDTTHSFAGIAKAAREERNPVSDITVEGGNAHAEYVDYDALRGSYLFKMDGTGFNEAYYDAPDLHYTAPLRFSSSDDRDIYVRMNGAIGCLEAGAILDDQGLLAPIGVMVCKNFQGDGGEPYYGVKDWMYGDSFFPLRLQKDKELRCTLLNLYQNWGKTPLKQISSIEFHVSYYHLSTGVTESNCIAPYFVYDRDGWTLPDFRGRSGVMWSGQPQFNSVGCLYFPRYQRSLLKNLVSEYRGSRIDSVGPGYADVTTFYRSDCGSYDYSLRHLEFPQTDENRTYYTLDLTFRRDMTFEDARSDFALFSFDGRAVKFNRAGWLDADNQPQSKALNLAKSFTESIPLGSENPYFGYFDMSPSPWENFGASFALIVKSSEITLGGAPWEGGFAFKNSWDGSLNTGALALNAGRMDFNAGDRIRVDFILLPWGTGEEKNDDTVRAVRADSCLNPWAATVTVGSVLPDAYLPVIESDGGAAQFTLSGGRNNNAVRVNGFASPACPVLERKVDGGGWEAVELASTNGYDGCTAFYNAGTGLYDFAFVLQAAADGGAVEYRCAG